jgi:hypothetical protein
MGRKKVKRYQYNIDMRTEENRAEVTQAIAALAKAKGLKYWQTLLSILQKELRIRKIKINK